jgi:GT2 family glycosyltransferase
MKTLALGPKACKDPMDYSIVIPVFNREDLTRNCLATLLPTLAGAGDGEVIVVDNGSRPETAAVLAEFPWARVIRNEQNNGFAVACNQGARAATGRFIVHLNNDTVALDGWLAKLLARFDDPAVGISGARLLFPDGTLQHAGVLLRPVRFGPEGFGPFHFLWKRPGDSTASAVPLDFEAVTGACLVTPRELFLELGGFCELYWNGYEDVDYCLAVRARGLRVVYEPSAVLFHHESQSGVQRKRRLMHNIRLLAARWARTIAPDHNKYCYLTGYVRREEFTTGMQTFVPLKIPPITIVVHGERPSAPDELVARINEAQPRPDRIIWAAEGAAPSGTHAIDGSAVEAVRNETELRGDRYVAFLSTSTRLENEWLAELIDAVEFARDIVAGTVVDPGDESDAAPIAGDARCTIVAMRNVPQHVRIDTQFETVSGAVTDWILRTVGLGRSVRRTYRPTAELGPRSEDVLFRERYGCSPASLAADSARMEELSRPLAATETLASIVMLSWNAPEYTEMAVRSIREHTSCPYEIIIIDNGSSADTIARLRMIKDIQVIYNDRNTGFAHGCNQGIAAAVGSHIVLLNNDVIVTDGWLEVMLDAQRRDRTVGVSAPRSNFVAGHQQLYNAQYDGPDAIQAFAAERSSRLERRTYHTDRVIGFCLCIARNVIDEIGGIDTRYPVGNFEDDDFCIRVRAAGYEIVVCEDSFIHHFGNISFKANKVDYGAQLTENWKIFAERWGLPRAYPTQGYSANAAISRGFVREQHYVALPTAKPERPLVPQPERVYLLALLAIVENEGDWSRLAPVVGNFARALTAADEVVLAIAVCGETEASTIAARVERALVKVGVDPNESPDIDISDVDLAEIANWRARFGQAQLLAVVESAQIADVEAVADRSRSGLIRLVRGRISS